ncbi:MAG TPA: hypothetical protein VFN78_03830 [Ktedonobacterales bacterium]|nr:hypothetical protein [Ktedonobacterales bacterium]
MASDMAMETVKYLNRRAADGAGVSDKLVTCAAVDMAVAAEEVEKLLVENERLRAREAALVAVARAVGEADNSDNSVCYQVCDYSMHGAWMIEHEAPCVVKQARVLLADAPTAE